MIKKILIAFFCVTAHGLFAQNGTISPYSYFGIGDNRDNGTVDNQMMGGVSMYGDSIHINLSNPAAYSKLKLTTRPVVPMVADPKVRVWRYCSILCEQTMGRHAEKSDQNLFNHSVCVVFQ